MALSRPLSVAALRQFSSSAARLSADAAHGHGGELKSSFLSMFSGAAPIFKFTSFPILGGYKIWRNVTYFVCFPAIALATFINLGPNASHEHRPEFQKYEYMRIRTKVSAAFSNVCKLFLIIFLRNSLGEMAITPCSTMSRRTLSPTAMKLRTAMTASQS